MEPERPFKWSSKISAESKRSNISSCRSLERGSWDDRERSLTKQHTMIEVMSLQGSKKSDIYEKMLAEDKSRRNQSSSYRQEEKQFNPFKSTIKFTPEHMNNRFSYEQRQEVNHICTCYQSCNEERCPCAAAKEQECLVDYCCRVCVQIKSRRVVRSGLNFEPQQKIFCTCKKTKCNKKYCTCFAAGQKCGYSCSCEDCLNCDRPQKMEVQLVCIVDEEIRKMEMPQSMDFQPFQFHGNNSGL